MRYEANLHKITGIFLEVLAVGWVCRRRRGVEDVDAAMRGVSR